MLLRLLVNIQAFRAPRVSLQVLIYTQTGLPAKLTHLHYLVCREEEIVAILTRKTKRGRPVAIAYLFTCASRVEPFSK